MNLTIKIPDDEVRALEQKAREHGVSPEEYARQLLARELKSGPRKHISQRIRENMRDVPQEVVEQLPSDGAAQHDHYIYGAPKRE